MLSENVELQQQLRQNRNLIPVFIEEVLRLQGPTKAEYRLARTRTKIGDVDVPAGATIMLLISAMNRDPRRFERADEVWLERPNVRDHIAFGRGVHACAGAPLARAETKISLERIFDRTSSLEIDEEVHGPRDARRFEYEPTFTMRGLSALSLRFGRPEKPQTMERH
jgi:cytochrome P450